MIVYISTAARGESIIALTCVILLSMHDSVINRFVYEKCMREKEKENEREADKSN